MRGSVRLYVTVCGRQEVSDSCLIIIFDEIALNGRILFVHTYAQMHRHTDTHIHTRTHTQSHMHTATTATNRFVLLDGDTSAMLSPSLLLLAALGGAVAVTPISNWQLVSSLNVAQGPKLAFHAAATLSHPEFAEPRTRVDAHPQHNLAFVFGGFSSFIGTLNDIWSPRSQSETSRAFWMYDLDTNTWKFIEPLNGIFSPAYWPTQRVGHAMGALKYNGSAFVVLFGGSNRAAGNGSTLDHWFDDTWVWEFDHNVLGASYYASWLRLTTASAPSKRWGFASQVYNNALYISGGVGAPGAVVDVWMFTLTSPTTGTWTELIAPLPTGPATRFGHSLGIYLDAGAGLSFVLTGGWSSFLNNNTAAAPFLDTWVAPLTTPGAATWQSLTLPLHPGVAFPATVVLSLQGASEPTTLVMRGMPSSYRNTFSTTLYPVVSDNIYKFDSTRRTWVAVVQDYLQSVDDYPGSTLAQTPFIVGNDVSLFGGFNTFMSILSNLISRTSIECLGE